MLGMTVQLCTASSVTAMALRANQRNTELNSQQRNYLRTTAMVIASESCEAGIGRRDLLALVGTTAAAQCVAAIPAMTQSQASPTAAAPPTTKPSVVLERLPMGVLLIGIDRVEAQNRIDIPTFSALGQAYYEFEH